MRRFVVVSLAVAMALAGAVMTGPAGAVVPGRNGRIVFARCVWRSSCGWELIAANPDDTGEVVLAGPYPRDAWDDHFIANWSPDGTKVVFMVYQGIWEVNADGSNLHLVWSPPNDGTGLDDGPSFTPDGTRIVFTRCCPEATGYSLWSINADGTGLRDITSEPFVNGDGPSHNLPQVSPNGKKIVFHRCVPDDSPWGCTSQIAVVNMNGSNMRLLTPPSMNAQLANWSPDSKTIVFRFNTAEGPTGIGTINADGTGLRELTFGTRSYDDSPAFSPDGTRIMFARAPTTGGGFDLFTMRPDGSRVTQVTKTADSDLWAEWAAA